MHLTLASHNDRPTPAPRCWVKICGNTTLDDALYAARAGADALGFIFAPSPRQLSRKEARAITTRLPRSVEKYGVFVDPTFEEVTETVSEAALTGVQLHTTPDPNLALRLREHFSRNSRTRIGILRVLHYEIDLADQLGSMRQDHAVDARADRLAHGQGRRRHRPAF